MRSAAAGTAPASPRHEFHIAERPSEYPGDFVRLGLAAGLFFLTSLAIRRDELSALERDVFRLINDLPGWLLVPVGVVQQLGTRFAPIVIGLLVIVALRRVRLGFSRRSVFTRDNYRCQYCARRCSPSEITCDHVLGYLLTAPEFREDWDKYNVWQYVSKVDEQVVRAYSMANYPGERGIIMLNVRVATSNYPTLPADQVVAILEHSELPRATVTHDWRLTTHRFLITVSNKSGVMLSVPIFSEFSANSRKANPMLSIAEMFFELIAISTLQSSALYGVNVFSSV